MSNANDDNASPFFDTWSSSMRGMMDGYARMFTPEWLSQPILPGWRIGNTYIVSEENSRDPGMERQIVAENSYGRQLGRIMDALCVLVNEQPEAARNADGPLKAFLELAADIQQLKEKSLSRRVDRIKADLKLLKDKCPDEFERLIKELQ